MVEALISVGANIALPGRSLRDSVEWALKTVADMEGFSLGRRSRLFRNPAYPPGSGPDFINAAAILQTALDPEGVLAALHGAEAALGRVRAGHPERRMRWAPRVCDLDLIAIGDTVLPDRQTLDRWMALDLGAAQTVAPPRLILPHPRMHERGFVLVPLADIAPRWRHPATGRSVAEMVAGLPAEVLAEIRPLT